MTVEWLNAMSQSAKRPTFFLTHPVDILCAFFGPGGHSEVYFGRLEWLFLKVGKQRQDVE